MDYLFFDLECANSSGGGKICEFGYVLTDESFSIKDKGIMIINPGYDENGQQEKFITEDRPIEGISFAFPFETYRAAPEFPYFYERIKEIMMRANQLVFGYAVTNDIRFFNYTAKRYGLDLLDYDAYDVAEYVKYDRDDEKSINLGKAFQIYATVGAPQGLVEHCSKDDAEFTMHVLRGILEKQNIDLQGFLAKIHYKPLSAIQEVEREEEEKEARKNYVEFCKECKPYIYDSGYVGVRISLSREAQNNLDFVLSAIDLACKYDLLFVKFGELTDYLLCLNQAELESRKRQTANMRTAYDLILIDELERM